MGAARVAVACLLAAAAAATGPNLNGTWSLVDVPQVVCPHTEGQVALELPLDSGRLPSNASDPHVLTFLRSSTKAVNLTLLVTDSSSPQGKMLFNRTLILIGWRQGRLRSLQDDSWEDDDSESDGGPASPPSPAPEDRWHTTAAGVFGYPDLGVQDDSFGEDGTGTIDYNTTWYGYSGKGVYEAGSNISILVAGSPDLEALANDQLNWASRWHSLDNDRDLEQYCYDIRGVYYASCKECVHEHLRQQLPASDCRMRYVPDTQLTRDDIMIAGFIPDHVQGPLRVTITRVEGEDYSQARVCPPERSADSPDEQSYPPDPVPDIFVKLTRMQRIAADQQPGAPQSVAPDNATAGNATAGQEDTAVPPPAPAEGGERAAAGQGRGLHWAITSFITACCCGACVCAGVAGRRCCLRRRPADDPLALYQDRGVEEDSKWPEPQQLPPPARQHVQDFKWPEPQQLPPPCQQLPTPAQQSVQDSASPEPQQLPPPCQQLPTPAQQSVQELS